MVVLLQTTHVLNSGFKMHRRMINVCHLNMQRQCQHYQIQCTTTGQYRNYNMIKNRHNINPTSININNINISNNLNGIKTCQRFETGIVERTSDDKSLPPGVLSHTILSPVSKSVSNIAKLPIITMHGLFGFKANLRSIVANSKINNDRTVVTLDLRNHGDSFHASEMSLDCMSKDIGTTMDYLEIKHAVLLGHSLGGRVAMTASLYDPRRIQGIIVADVAPVDYQGYKVELYYKMIDVFKNLPTKDYFDKKSDALNYVASLLPELTELELNFLMASFVQNENEEWYWKLNLDAIRDHIEEFNEFKIGNEIANKKYFGQAYFIGGTNSKYIKPGKSGEHEQAIAKLFPNYKLEMIENAGHMVHVDKPVQFTDAVCRALDSMDKEFKTSRFY